MTDEADLLLANHLEHPFFPEKIEFHPRVQRQREKLCIPLQIPLSRHFVELAVLGFSVVTPTAIASRHSARFMQHIKGHFRCFTSLSPGFPQEIWNICPPLLVGVSLSITPECFRRPAHIRDAGWICEPRLVPFKSFRHGPENQNESPNSFGRHHHQDRILCDTLVIDPMNS